MKISREHLKRFTDVAYNVKSQEKFEKKFKNIPEGFDLLTKTTATIGENQYKAAVFINHNTKQLILANAGTKHEDFIDLYDDALLSFGYIPSKLAAIQSFFDDIEQKLPNFREYKFHTTGHSLGAVLSDISALEAQSRGFDVEGSYTFESPGSAKIVNRAINHNVFKGSCKVDRSILSFENENNKPNFINTLNAHVGKVKMCVFKPNKNEEQKLEKTNEGNGFFSKIKNFCNSIQQQITDHKLSSFLEHENKAVAVECWPVGEGQPILSFDEKLAEYIKLAPNTNRDDSTYDSDSSSDTFSMISCSDLEEQSEGFVDVNKLEVYQSDLQDYLFHSELS